MHIRLDPDIADFVRRDARAHQRLFKRRKSYNTIVNMLLKDVIKVNSNHQQPAIRHENSNRKQ